MTQRERTQLYLRTMINPVGYVKAGFSAGLDQWNDKPKAWEQGASGNGKRYANILGRYYIQRTVTFGVSSALHEDNRYFNSGKTGFGRISDPHFRAASSLATIMAAVTSPSLKLEA
jgi:hypothetical protein